MTDGGRPAMNRTLPDTDHLPCGHAVDDLDPEVGCVVCLLEEQDELEQAFADHAAADPVDDEIPPPDGPDSDGTEGSP